MADIHPSAIIEPGAELHDSVVVGPFSIVESGAVLGEGCVVESNARIYAATRMGRHNRVCHGVTLGSEPQDLSYTPDKSRPLTIGDHNHFKENVNISRGVKTEHGTVIGSHNYFMAFSHAGHDCVVGDHNIFANAATLGGHVELAHHVFVSGHVAVHQFCHIGAYAMLSGVSGVAQDVPPYITTSGSRAEMVGLNLVGLRRNGFTPAQRNAIKQAYKVLYRTGLKREEALAVLKTERDAPEVQEIVRFVENSTRGLVSQRRQ